MLIDNLKEPLSVHELQAHRALAMAERFLRAKAPKEFVLKRVSMFARTLKTLSKNEDISDETAHKILVIAKKCKDLKRSLSPSPVTPPSSSVKSSYQSSDISTARKTERENHNSPASRKNNDEASIDHIQSLLIEQKEMQSKELSHERKNQEAIITELVGMTDILKETTIKIHNSVKRQNHQLQEIHHFASRNEQELEQQKKKMAERTKSMTRSLWTNIWLILWLVCLFIATLTLMKLIPKPSTSHQCPAKF